MIALASVITSPSLFAYPPLYRVRRLPLLPLKATKKRPHTTPAGLWAIAACASTYNSTVNHEPDELRQYPGAITRCSMPWSHWFIDSTICKKEILGNTITERQEV